ncbi:LysR family transcriptional regulator [Jannaschia aquimarina]|uniref:DNA-binding transcriptional activator GcvA n=1 Tax=Jannaschia aquimarina TaxID=935700 RepID=A0A0D1EKJ7_9RHOB|nr:LysR family transcriptional regulator [Jannaschia aquimarina]KIT16280.1 DNA-binding transcriptional activator GcvA [Jannaschia aquimarina]SNT14705.1 transcriptional regulator, LysR family [Jannaschia aquimarina]
MQDPIAWNDLALFAAVARTGTLARAADETGTSTATLSRRMTGLEARLGRRLFRHGVHGYALTEDGRALLARTERMEEAAADIGQWREAGSGPVRVRLSAGTWTSQALAADVTRYWSPEACWIPEMVHCDRDMDIARREVDIGIRNRRPDQPWLAGRRTATVRYAAYGQEGVGNWIGVSFDAAHTPSGRWVIDNHGGEIVTAANDPRWALALARAGIGRVVLPMFIGEESGLPRLSDPIEDLTHEEWLVSHHEARHETPIRTALDALAGYLSERLPP